MANIGPASRRNALVFGLFIFLFLLVFKPFGLSMFQGPIWKVALGYGATCTAVMLLLNSILARFLPKFFSEPDWTVGREMAWTLVNVALIGLANLLYSVAIGFARFSLEMLLWFEAYTLLIGLFPVTVVILWTEARLSRRYRQGSAEVNAAMPKAAASVEGQVGEAAVPSEDVVTIIIPSENGREDMALSRRDLLFIRSAGNYLEVHHSKGDDVTRQVLRGSLKRAEEALTGHPRLLRCHKSHLVNLDRVATVSGNAQGYHLHLDRGADTVPVSRKLNESLAGLLAVRP
jgi:hypothetical protein